MQNQSEGRPGLNGSGAGYPPAATPGDVATAGVEAAADGNGATDAGGVKTEAAAAPVVPSPETMAAVPAEGEAVSSPGDAATRPLGGRRHLALLVQDPAWRKELERRVTTTIEPLTGIARDLGIDLRALGEYVGRVGLVRPKGAPVAGRQRLASGMSDAGDVRDRLLRVVDRQVGKIDAKLSRKDAEVDERDSRILGNLAKTLGVLMQTGEGGKTSKEAEPPDRDEEADARLAERIRSWARGEQGY